MSAKQFSVCVLLYGTHVDLAKRCLESLLNNADPQRIKDLRVGLNMVGATTAKYLLDSFIPEWSIRVDTPVYTYSEFIGRNVYKYPLMRRMFYDEQFPLAPKVMWFDDDSYLRGNYEHFWEDVSLLSNDYMLVGPMYRFTGYRPGQIAGIKAQPWYGNVDPGRGNRLLFCQGGWWVTRSTFLAKWDYPFKELIHNNGDVLLGELIRQRGESLVDFRKGVAANANEQGRESAAERRGQTSLWPWQSDYMYDEAAHDFKVQVFRFNDRNSAHRGN